MNNDDKKGRFIIQDDEDNYDYKMDDNNESNEYDVFMSKDALKRKYNVNNDDGDVDDDDINHDDDDIPLHQHHQHHSQKHHDADNNEAMPEPKRLDR